MGLLLLKSLLFPEEFYAPFILTLVLPSFRVIFRGVIIHGCLSVLQPQDRFLQGLGTKEAGKIVTNEILHQKLFSGAVISFKIGGCGHSVAYRKGMKPLPMNYVQFIELDFSAWEHREPFTKFLVMLGITIKFPI